MTTGVSVGSFVYETLPSRVVFGAGTLRTVADEVRRLGRSRVLLIADISATAPAAVLRAELGSLLVGEWGEVVQHVPVELAERARAHAAQLRADVVVSVGGGSATGLAKALALTNDTVTVAIPTTYAGSEMTTIYGMTGGAHKATGKDARVAPRTVIYDPELTIGLPPMVTGPSAFNALAHCVEAMYGPGHNPVVSALAIEGVRAIGRSLQAAVANGDDLAARSDLLYGAYLAGVALGATGTALHHKACHVLGGTFNLIHGDANAVVLPHAVAYNQSHALNDMDRVRDALGVPTTTTAAAALFDLARSVGAPTSLAQLGMPEGGLDDAAQRTVVETTVNPRPVDVPSVRAMLDDAFHGRRPA